MRIRVLVKKRPMSRKESEKGDCDVIQPVSDGSVIVHQPKLRVDLTREVEVSQFQFDGSFGECTCNLEVYEGGVKGLVECAVKGDMGTVFAYGQTGSGKTFTMMGSDMTGERRRREDNSGLYYLAGEIAGRARRARGDVGWFSDKIYCTAVMILYCDWQDPRPVLSVSPRLVKGRQ